MSSSLSSGPAVGLILSAGAGSRYGRPKVTAAGGRWLAGAIDALRGDCEQILVTLGAAQVELPDDVTPVPVPRWRTGLSASVSAGIASATELPDAQYLVIHLVDVPDVSAAVVHRVVDAARAGDSGLARAYYGDVPGHPVVIERRHWADVAASVTGDQGAGRYLSAHHETVAAVQCADLASGADHDYPISADPQPSGRTP